MAMRVVILGSVLVSASCGGVLVDPRQSGQEYLFEVSYVNFAWGLQWEGIFVDGEGDIFTYERDTPWSPEREDSFTEAELADRYGPEARRIGEVPADELFRQLGRVDDVGDRFESPNLACADAGTVSYEAFRFDPATRRYTPVVVRQEGDAIRQNRSGAGRELAEWLMELAAESGRNRLTQFHTSGSCTPES